MASLKYHRDVRRWRVFWHVTLADGQVDKGSRSFKDKIEAGRFKEHCEKQAVRLKRARVVEAADLEDAIEQWQVFIKRYTSRTQGLYESVMQEFQDYLPEEVILITDLQTRHVSGYLNYLMGRKLKNKTINNHLSAVKSLCSYLEENYKIENVAKCIRKLKEDPPDVHFLTTEDYKQIVEHCDENAKGWIKFIANTGVRATEFCRLRWKDYNADARTITVTGKGRKRRTIGLNRIAVEVLEEIKRSRRVKRDSFIFYRKDGESLSRHTLHNYVSKACCNAGQPIVGPHALRHFFATQLLLAGVAIIKVSAVLGHSSITTTQRHYAHILSPDLSGITGVLEAL